MDNVEKEFNIWLELMHQYHTTKSFYDDPILKAFSDEYFSDFEILDEDASTAPFETSKILILDKYLEHIYGSIDKYKLPENEENIAIIKEEILVLKKNLTTKSKAFIIRNLSNIWAKLTKLGTKFISDFTSETKRELLKRSVKGVLDFIIETGGELIQ